VTIAIIATQRDSKTRKTFTCHQFWEGCRGNTTVGSAGSIRYSYISKQVGLVHPSCKSKRMLCAVSAAEILGNISGLILDFAHSAAIRLLDVTH
jgi:hypothetical protein